jgi:class 3 adenylate cyclase
VRTCPSCRRKNDDEARFCVSCGAKLAVLCGECGAELPPGAGFCPTCGTPVRTRARLAGEERKVITVLFSDLVDSTAHAEQLDPEDLRGLHSPYFTRVRAEVERFGGTVEKFIGDAVMALFGAPVAHEDDPERAVRAALAIRDSVPELNENSPELELHVRIAVNTGEAVVDLGASPGEGEGMVAGDVVNTCARLQTAAPVDGILVGESTYRATAGAIEYRELAPVHAKGKQELVLAWQAVQLAADGRARPPSQLVGRTQELSHLLDALVRVCKERNPQLVSLVGEPGIGKTRLVRELVGAVESEPNFGSWLGGRCLPYGDGVSFAALAEMARSESGILTSDSSEEAAAKLRAAVEALPGEIDAGWLESHLRPLVGLEGAAAERREDSFSAWRRFFEALSEREPLVLVFEDLHWADPGVLDFIDYLVDWASGVPLLVLCTARPELLERRPDWGGGKRNAITISLSPLSQEETGELVHALLGQPALPAAITVPLVTHAGGNPLYAEEYARMLVERGFLVREKGGWRLADEDLPLPESVQGTIAARVDGLPRDEKAVLQQAAVVGKVFWLGAVASCAGIERTAAERLLHALERKEFVRRERRSSVANEVQYTFRHVLVRDVAYAQLPRARRADAHSRAAAWVEGLPGVAEDQAEQLAHHYRSALELARALGEDTTDVAVRAALAFHRAGERALGLNAYEAAARFFAEELELLPEDDGRRRYALLGLGRGSGDTEGAGTFELTPRGPASSSSSRRSSSCSKKARWRPRRTSRRRLRRCSGDAPSPSRRPNGWAGPRSSPKASSRLAPRRSCSAGSRASTACGTTARTRSTTPARRWSSARSSGSATFRLAR